MRDCRDTIISFLREYLDGSIPIHHVRQSSQNSEAGFIQANSINVEFSMPTFGTAPSPSTLNVEIDVINDDELVAFDWAQQVSDILHAGTTPKLHYVTDQAGSVVSTEPVGSNIWWNPHTVRFRPIQDPSGYRLKCSVYLYHHISS